MAKRYSPKGLSRVDTESTNVHGWLVRIMRKNQRHSRFFSDATWGSKAKSKRQAMACYQEWTEQFGEPETIQDKITKRNSTGVVGVHLTEETSSQYPNWSSLQYVASWQEDGKRRSIRFPIRKYGKKLAFQLAKLARQQKIADREKVVQLFAKTSPVKKTAKTRSTKKR